MTALANGASVGDSDRSNGTEDSNPAWPTGRRPVIEVSEAQWPLTPPVQPSGVSMSDGGTAVFAMVPTKEVPVSVPGRGMEIHPRLAPERRVLMLITARIVGGGGR